MLSSARNVSQLWFSIYKLKHEIQVAAALAGHDGGHLSNTEPDWKFFFLPPSNTHNGLFYLVLASCFISQRGQVFLAAVLWHRSLSAKKGIIVGHQQRRVMQSRCLLGI